MAVSKNLTYLSGASSATGTTSTKKKEEETKKLAMPNALTNSVPSNNSSADTILKNLSVPKTYTAQTTPTTSNTSQVTYPSMLAALKKENQVINNNPSGITYGDVAEALKTINSTPAESVISNTTSNANNSANLLSVPMYATKQPTETSPMLADNLAQGLVNKYYELGGTATPSANESIATSTGNQLVNKLNESNTATPFSLADLVPGSAEANAAVEASLRRIYGDSSPLNSNATISTQSNVSNGNTYADTLDELIQRSTNENEASAKTQTSGNANGTTGGVNNGNGYVATSGNTNGSTGQPTTGAQSGYAFTYNGETITPDNPDYERYLNEALAQLGAAYNTRQQALSDNYESALAQLKSVYDASASNINNNSNEALRQAYIDSMLGRRDLARRLSNAGLTGGAVESVLANMYNNYGNNRNAIENQRSNNLNSLASTYNSNVANLGQNYNENYADALADYQESTANVNKNFGKELAEMLQKTNSNAQAAYQAQLNAALESALNQMQNNAVQSASNPSSDMQSVAQNTSQNAQTANELANVNGRTNVGGGIINNTTGRGIAPANGTQINLNNSGITKNINGMNVEQNVIDNIRNLNSVNDYNGLASYIDTLDISGEQAERLLAGLGVDTYRLSRLINL